MNSNKAIYIKILLLYTCFGSQYVLAQGKDIFNDTIINKDFLAIEKLFFEAAYKNDSLNSFRYADIYLKKAFVENDSLNIVKGYLLKTSTTFDREKIEKYADSSILYSPEKPNLSDLSLSYSIKAGTYFDNNNYKKSLDLYLLAYETAIKGNDIYTANIMKYSIGEFKARIGLYDEALKYGRESWKYFKSKGNKDLALDCLFLLSTTYTNNALLDSASYYNNLGIKNSKTPKDSRHYSRFQLLEGVNQFYKKNYSATIDSLNKAIPKLKSKNDNENVAASYLYLGKSFLKLEKNDMAISSFKKMDTIFIKENNLLPYCREGYQILINFYRKEKDLNQQLYYTNQLLRLDSILNNNYQYLSSTIYTKHETPLLIKEKEKIIDELENNTESYFNYIYFLILLSIITFFGLLYNYRKKQKYVEKFRYILEEYNSIKMDKNSQVKVVPSVLDIDNKIVIEILENLSLFEQNLDFLEHDIKLNALSKKFNTNSKYLSKIINEYKGKSFPQYINDLRIEYIIKQLGEDTKLQKYTISSIAEIAGFGNVRSFTNAFFKKTGLKPSYFLKELKKSMN